MSNVDTSSREFFEQKYREATDPWSFATSAYEQRRYATIIEHIAAGRFTNVFEPGCSVGELTVQLAERCGQVTAIDIAETAVVIARRRCAALGNVDIEQGSLPDDLPPGPFDLIVFSEIGYYFDEDRVRGLARDMTHRISAGGWLIAVHWTGEACDHVLAGATVHEVLDRQLGMEHVTHEEHLPEVGGRCDDGFLLDIRQRGSKQGSLG